MSRMPRSRVLVGRVAHSRLAPTPHAFAYRLFVLGLDLGELEAIDRRSWIVGTGAWRLVRLVASDFLGVPPGDGRSAAETVRLLRAAVLDRLASHGVSTPIGRIELVGQLRLAGYVFNPVAFFVCHAASGDGPVAVVADVHNTFGERHAYVVPVGADAPARVWMEKKVFHVSPFFSLDGSYRFALRFDGDEFDVHIDLLRDGQPVFLSHLRLAGTPLTDRSLAAALVRWPVMTLRVIAAIHWEAFRLWRKGLAFHGKPPYDPAQARATRP